MRQAAVVLGSEWAVPLPRAAARALTAPLTSPRPLPPPPHATDHVREAFPGWEVEFKNGSRSPTLERPFRVTFPPLSQDAAGGKPQGGKRKGGAEGGAAAAPERKLVVESYTPVDPGPYPQDLPPQNTVRFTPVQTQAIMSGVQPGLTMVVGPPGARRQAGGRAGA